MAVTLTFSNITYDSVYVQLKGLYSWYSSGTEISFVLDLYDKNKTYIGDVYSGSFTVNSDTSPYVYPIRDLDANTVYYVVASIQEKISDSITSTRTTDYFSFTTEALDPELTVSFSSISATKATAKISGLYTGFSDGNEMSYTLNIYKNGSLYKIHGDTVIVSGDTISNIQFKNLEPSTDYTVELTVTKLSNDKTFSFDGFSFSTNALSTALSFSNVTATKATPVISNLLSEFSSGSYALFTFKVYKGSSLIDTIESKIKISSATKTFSNAIRYLSSSTSYTVSLTIKEAYEDDNISFVNPTTLSLSASFTTSALSIEMTFTGVTSSKATPVVSNLYSEFASNDYIEFIFKVYNSSGSLVATESFERFLSSTKCTFTDALTKLSASTTYTAKLTLKQYEVAVEVGTNELVPTSTVLQTLELSGSFTTDELAIQVTTSNIKATQASATVSGLSTEFDNGDYITIRFSIYKSNSLYKSYTQNNLTISGDTKGAYAFTGLQPSTSYALRTYIDVLEPVINANTGSIAYYNTVQTFTLSTVNFKTNSLGVTLTATSYHSETTIPVAVNGLLTEFDNRSVCDFEFELTASRAYLNTTANWYSNTITSTSKNFTISGLTAGVTYTIKLTITCGDTVITLSTTATTDGTYIPPAPETGNIFIEQNDDLTTSTQIGLSLYGLDDSYFEDYSVTWYFTLKAGTTQTKTSTIPAYSSYVNSSPFTGLTASTSYTAYAIVKWGTNGSYTTETITVTTKDPDDSIWPIIDGSTVIVATSTGNSITAYLTGVNTSYEATAVIWLIWSLFDGAGNRVERIDGKYIHAGESTSDSVTFFDLLPNSGYEVRVQLDFTYAGDDRQEYILCDVITSNDPNYIPEINEDELLIDELTADDDNSLKLRVEGLDPLYTGIWEFEWDVYLYNHYDNTVKNHFKTIYTSADASAGGFSKSPAQDLTGLFSGSQYYVHLCVTATIKGVSYSWETYRDNLWTDGEYDTLGGAENAQLIASFDEDREVIEAYLTVLNSEYDTNERRVYWYVNRDPDTDGSTLWSSIEAHAIMSPVVNFDIQSGIIVYNIIAVLEYDGGEVRFSKTITINGDIFFDDARLVLAEKTYTSLEIYVDNLDEEYSFDDRYIEWYLNSVETDPIDTTPLAAYSPESDPFLIDNLEEGITYTIIARIYFSNGLGYKDVTGSFSTMSHRPDEFRWTSVVEQSYPWEQHSNGGYYGITAKEWGQLLDNINAVRTYFNLAEFPIITLSVAQSQSYPNGFTYPSSGDEFLAIYFNQALAGIAGIYSEKKGVSGVYTDNYVTSGESKITAECLNNLVSLLNYLE